MGNAAERHVTEPARLARPAARPAARRAAPRVPDAPRVEIAGLGDRNVVIVGEAGAGKTTLIDWFCRPSAGAASARDGRVGAVDVKFIELSLVGHGDRVYGAVTPDARAVEALARAADRVDVVVLLQSAAAGRLTRAIATVLSGLEESPLARRMMLVGNHAEQAHVIVPGTQQTRAERFSGMMRAEVRKRCGAELLAAPTVMAVTTGIKLPDGWLDMPADVSQLTEALDAHFEKLVPLNQPLARATADELRRFTQLE